MPENITKEFVKEIQSVVKIFGLEDVEAAGMLAGIAEQYMQRTGVSKVQYYAAALKNCK